LSAFWGTAQAVPFPIKGKIKVKGSGQECPLHTPPARFHPPNPALGLLFERYPVIIADGLIAHYTQESTHEAFLQKHCDRY
jgi:hypothetical protein